MTIVKINDEGIEALQRTASSISNAAEELNESSVKLLTSVDNYSDTIGPHVDSIADAIESIQAALNQAIDPVEGVSDKLNELADKYQAIVDNDRFSKLSGSGGGLSGLSSSSGSGSGGSPGSSIGSGGATSSMSTGSGGLSGDSVSDVKSAGSDWCNALSDTEKEAVHAYTDTAYSNINQKLRGKTDSWDSGNLDRAKAIHSALGRSSIPCDCTVYRGGSSDILGSFKNLSDEELKGKILKDNGFMSTSLDRGSAFGGNILLEIDVPKGSKGAYVGDVSHYNHIESEVLFDCNSMMVINDVQSIGGQRIIKASMINKNLIRFIK